jgi:hypothetical protein
MTKWPDLFAALAAPFRDGEVKQRQQAGRTLSYVTARTVQNRLDSVLGAENWWNEFVKQDEHSVVCKLTIRLPDGSTVTKADAGGYAGMSDQGDDDKSGYSDALKRAAVMFGVSRYLYRDGVPEFVREAIPAGSGHHAPPAEASRTLPTLGKTGPPPAFDDGDRPRSGKALFAWVKNQEERTEVGLLNYLNRWSKDQGFPARMVDWDEGQVSLAHAEAVRKLGGGRREAEEPANFDRPRAWSALYERAEALARGLFPSYGGTAEEVFSALSSLDPEVPEALRVEDWDRCEDRSSFEAYYRAAQSAIRDLQRGEVPR